MPMSYDDLRALCFKSSVEPNTGKLALLLQQLRELLAETYTPPERFTNKNALSKERQTGSAPSRF